jgi:peptidoglycan/xylan/chitin deacetylase (PgdA/CDA1 family)
MLIRALFSAVSPAGQQGKLAIFIFHRVFPAPDVLMPDEPDIKRFDEIMGWLASWFNVLPLDEAIARLKNGDLPQRAAAITFDDGYADNLTCAVPILKKHGLSATFFIATGYLDGGRMWNDTLIESVRLTTLPTLDATRFGLGNLPFASIENKRSAIDKLILAIKHLPAAARHEAVEFVRENCSCVLPNDLMLTTPQLRELRAAGMGIGAHTISHPILATLDEPAARQEIAASRDRLEALLGERVGLFAYPNGKLGADYTARHAAIVKSLGFDAAVATNWGICSQGSDPYQLPRFTPWDKTRLRFGLRMLKTYWANNNGASA